MALTDTTLVDYVGINRLGNLEVRKARVVSDNGDELAQRYERIVLQPGDDLTTTGVVQFFASVTPADRQRVKAISDLVWTPAVIAARRARDAASSQPTP